MEIQVFNFLNKAETGSTFTLPESVFGLPYDNAFFSMHFHRMKDAHHIPTNKTKNVSEVSGTKRKPYKQKHTGNARQGSLRSAQFVGGGVAFGPRGLKHFTKLPKNEVKLAKAMILSERNRAGKFFVVNDVNLSSHKTKDALNIISQYSDRGAIIVHSKAVNPSSLLAVRNLEYVKYVDISMLTVFDLINKNVSILIDSASLNDLINSLSI